MALGLGAAPAGAHTEVQHASPAPAEEVTGVVAHVELIYLDPVLPDVQITVVDRTGTPVAGLGPVRLSADGRTARVDFEPLAVAGAYVVDHTFTARDGDQQRESYRFTYRPEAGAAPSPVSTGSSASDRDGDGWAVRMALPAAFVVVALVGMAVHRARRTGRAG